MNRRQLRSLWIIPLVILVTAAHAGDAFAAVQAKLTPPPGLLTPQDVPPALGKAKPGKHNYSVSGVPGTTDMDLCLAKTGEPPVTAEGAAGWMSTVVLTGKGYREVNERISTFATAGAAASTFQSLQSAASACTGKSRSPISDDSSHPAEGNYVNMNATGMTGDGVWISIDSKAKSKDEDIDGSVTTTYTVYRLSQNVITATWIYFNGTASTTASQRRAVNSLSLELTAP